MLIDNQVDANPEYDRLGITVDGIESGAPAGLLLSIEANNELARHPDVVAIRLVYGRRTLLDNRHWSALLSLVIGNDDWQTLGLSTPANTMLLRTKSNGILRIKELPPTGTTRPKQYYIRQLEERMLVYSHRLSGNPAHLESWTSWANRTNTRPNMPACQARQYFEKLILDAQLVDESRIDTKDARTVLPWLTSASAASHFFSAQVAMRNYAESWEVRAPY